MTSLSLRDGTCADRRKAIVFSKTNTAPFLILRKHSQEPAKQGGHGIPEAILMDRSYSRPLAVIEAKQSVDEADKALTEAQVYADALFEAEAWYPLAIGLAGTSDDEFILRVSKRTKSGKWALVTYESHPIGWIPTPADLERVANPSGPRESQDPPFHRWKCWLRALMRSTAF